MLARVLAAATIWLMFAAAASAQVYALATNPQGSLIFNAGAAVAKVAADKLKMQIRVQPMAGSSTYVPLLNSGEIEFGLVNVQETLAAVKGGLGFEGKPNPNLRIVAVLFNLPLSILVTADSSFKTIADLKGARMPSGYIGQLTVRPLQDALLASAGLSMKDVTAVPVVNAFQAVDALREGKLDAVTIGPGTAQVQQAHVELSGRGGVRFLSIDASSETVDVMRKFVPMRPLVVQPAPNLPGVVGPTTVMAYSMYLLASDKVADDVVHRLVKMLYESRDDLIKVTPVLNRFNPTAMSEQSDAPWHPGAIKFYGEVGQWPPKG
jgi:TRAP transporter TAXI family solute receptor